MIDKITSWIKNYCAENKIESLVVGISGGIDSSVVSTLCALTNLEVYAVSMPINQIKSQHDLSLDHGNWLTRNYKNVHHLTIDLSSLYNHFYKSLSSFESDHAFRSDHLTNEKNKLSIYELMDGLSELLSDINYLVTGSSGFCIEAF